MPPTLFAIVDVQAGYARLATQGARFLQARVEDGPQVTAVHDDTRWILIPTAQEKHQP